MTNSRSLWITRTLAAVWIVAGCRSAPREGPAATPAPHSGERRIYTAGSRADSARQPFTEADVRFMVGMIGHHGQAIQMSLLAPTNGARASVRTLAERIINAQQDEIAIMQQWLRDHGQPLPVAHSAGMPMHHGDGEVLMPGMLTAAQMRQLAEAKSADFDRLFLTSMIQHHRGAIAMVKELFATPGAAQDQSVFTLASDVNVDQTTEVARMVQMLSALIFERPPQ